MSQHAKGFIVTLDQDVSEEYAEKIANAIRMIAHVAAVDTNWVNTDDHVNRRLILIETWAEMRDMFDRLMNGK